jgi:glycosyltransferase involved in cell wall biosynthesis
MNQSNPLLSICIPTFNRSTALRRTIESITIDPLFLNTDQIEIVVSDNNSSDETLEVCQEYLAKFPDKFIYKKQTFTCAANLNFENALRLAHGKLMKLHNDNFIFLNGAIDFIINLINYTDAYKPIIFFSNRPSPEKEMIELSSGIDNFVQKASFVSTWLGSLSIWREHYNSMTYLSRDQYAQLITTDVFFQLISQYKNFLSVNQFLIASQDVGKKGGYSIAEVFAENYIDLLLERIKSEQLSWNTFTIEKKRVFFEHILPMSFTNSHNFVHENFMMYMHHYYKEDYFQSTIDNILKTAASKSIG